MISTRRDSKQNHLAESPNSKFVFPLNSNVYQDNRRSIRDVGEISARFSKIPKGSSILCKVLPDFDFEHSARFFLDLNECCKTIFSWKHQCGYSRKWTNLFYRQAPSSQGFFALPKVNSNVHMQSRSDTRDANLEKSMPIHGYSRKWAVLFFFCFFLSFLFVSRCDWGANWKTPQKKKNHENYAHVVK